VKQVQVTPTDGAARHLQNDIAFIDDLRASGVHYNKMHQQERRIEVKTGKRYECRDTQND
jgi:hypothetical protein